MMIGLIDAHAHHQDASDSEEIIKKSFESGISKIALGGTHPEDWKRQVQLNHLFKNKLFMHFGLHPWWVEKYNRAEIELILEQLDHELPLVSGLGETGLDFYSEKRDPSRFEDQRLVFRSQIRLSIKHQKPMVLHVVQAHEEALKILHEENASKIPLVMHRFSGNGEQLKQYLKLGACISFHESKKLMKEVPLDRLLLETDSNSKQHPGGWDIRPHYEKTAEIIGLPIQELIQKVAENFEKIGYSHTL